jgi:hypothetical protein
VRKRAAGLLRVRLGPGIQLKQTHAA